MSQAYWPFRSEITTSDNRKAVPASFIGDGRKATAPTKLRSSNGETELTYQSIEDNFDNLYRNTVIPDETFGPDEERIFIDVDPYDLERSIFGLQRSNSDNVRSVPSVMENAASKFTTKPDIDYIEESLKNVKRYWQGSRDESRGQWSTTPKDHVRSRIITESATENVGTDVYYVEDSSMKKEMPKERHDFANDGDKSINHGVYGNVRTQDSSTVTSTMMSKSLEDQLRTSMSSHRSSSHANRTIDYSNAFDDELDKRKIESHVENRTTDYTIARYPSSRGELENREREDTTLIDDRGSTVVEKNLEDVRNLSRNREDHAGPAEKASLVNLKEISRDWQRSTNGDKLVNVVTSTTMEEGNTTKNPAVESLAVLGNAI